MFTLKVGAKARINRVYFIEHDDDLFLYYGVHDGSSEWAYLVRMEQTKRKPRWITTVDISDVEAPSIKGDLVVIKSIEIDKTDGHVRQD